jgi:serine/threonine protein kinase
LTLLSEEYVAAVYFVLFLLRLIATPIQIHHHGFAADVWSFGVLAYICLSGCHPLDVTGEDEDAVVARRNRAGEVLPMTGEYWECVSEQARAFM